MSLHCHRHRTLPPCTNNGPSSDSLLTHSRSPAHALVHPHASLRAQSPRSARCDPAQAPTPSFDLLLVLTRPALTHAAPAETPANPRIVVHSCHEDDAALRASDVRPRAPGHIRSHQQCHERAQMRWRRQNGLEAHEDPNSALNEVSTPPFLTRANEEMRRRSELGARGECAKLPAATSCTAQDREACVASRARVVQMGASSF
ncbi:hypothetical protein DFH09DRAFT_1323854 [Mycena vulgaris]|nr:hypothetical protein DFH09DRAFT_1323854 [Mycena vulgaris]